MESVMRPFLVFLWFGAAFGQLSPGKLHQKHEHLEGVANCVQCHEFGTKSFREKCLTCHELLADRVQAQKGLHAKPSYQRCETCHSDHHGRDFDMVHWPQGTTAFDHKDTGFSLIGAHKKPDCRTCHDPKHVQYPEILIQKGKDLTRTFLGLTTACSSCHTDPHQGQLGDDCSSCHEEINWKPATLFDHQRAAFVLEGAHRDLTCSQCHEGDEQPIRYKPMDHATCNACHEDAHQGQLKGDCSGCHDVEAFRPASYFDHQKAAFALTGKHISVKCDTCHKQIVPSDRNRPYVKYKGIPHQACSDCHSDIHGARLGPHCEDCHQTSGWHRTPAFDHNQTRYPLLGKHRDVVCRSCHPDGRAITNISFENCTNCHKDTHVGQFKHRPQQGACEECHQVTGFVPAHFGTQDHAQTLFPLEGGHLATPCSECHTPILMHGQKTQKFRFEQALCQDCHRDPHEGSIRGATCESCHSVTSWPQSHFDHAVTRFPLVGAHNDVDCKACHLPTVAGAMVFQTIDDTCDSCHDDPHRNQFARSCNACHESTQWQTLRFFHDRDSRFPLEGAHANIDCDQCHVRVQDTEGVFVRYRPLAAECEFCHGPNRRN
ncbi:MAG: hypothetical protein KDC35_12070 [Acidobacteria bacterium]|nr:hypothetical protein [Acidobacteriota bacterium]